MEIMLFCSPSTHVAPDLAAVERGATLPPVLTERSHQDGDQPASVADQGVVLDRVAPAVDFPTVNGSYVVIELCSEFECIPPSDLPVGDPFVGIYSVSIVSFYFEVSMYPCWRRPAFMSSLMSE
jgi:hypothetical protein